MPSPKPTPTPTSTPASRSARAGTGGRRWLPWEIAATGVLAGVAGWLATTSLQQDFAAYYTAARARAAGLDPYVNQLGLPGGPWDGVDVYRHSRFLYPPLAADLLRPLAALPFAWAKVVFTAASVCALIWTLRQARRDTTPGPDAPAREPTTTTTTALAVALIAAVLWPPVFVALERGQTDLVLLALLAAAWRWRDRPWVAGPLLAACTMGKPLVAALIPLLLAARRWRWAGATVIALLLLAAANVVVSGRALSAEYVRQVLPRAALYGEGGPATLLLSEAALAPVSDDLAEGVARVDGAGRAYVQEIGSFPRNASLTRALATDRPPSTGLSLVVYGALAALLGAAAWRRPERAAWYWGGLVVAVLAAPVSWAMSLVWALPILLAAIPRVVAARARGALAVAAAIAIGAGFLGPLIGGAWIVAGVATVATAALLALQRAHELDGARAVVPAPKPEARA